MGTPGGPGFACVTWRESYPPLLQCPPLLSRRLPLPHPSSHRVPPARQYGGWQLVKRVVNMDWSSAAVGSWDLLCTPKNDDKWKRGQKILTQQDTAVQVKLKVCPVLICQLTFLLQAHPLACPSPF